MALKAYVFISIGSKKVVEILTKLKAAKGVLSAEAITGPYDIIAMIEAENIDAIGELVTQDILSVDGIDRTLTCFVLHL